MSLTDPFKLNIFCGNPLILLVLLMTSSQCKARITCCSALLQWPTQTLHSGSAQTFTAPVPQDMVQSPYTCHATHCTEQRRQKSRRNTTTMCTYVLHAFQSGFISPNASRLSKQHNSILRKKNLLFYDLIWARKITKRSNHCRTATSMKAKKKKNPFADQVDCTTLLSCSHSSCYTSSSPSQRHEQPAWFVDFGTGSVDKGEGDAAHFTPSCLLPEAIDLACSSI